MGISIRPDRATYFSEILTLALESVVPSDGPVFASRSYVDLDGHVLSGFAHEAQALLLLACLAGLPAAVPGDVLEEFALRALVDCKNKGRPDKEGFLESLRQELREYGRREATRYRCLFLLQSSNLPGWVTSTPILGHTIRPASGAAWRAAASGIQRICEQADVAEGALSSMQPVEVSVATKRPIEAIDAAEQACRLLRGAYLLTQGSSWRFGGGPSGLNEFKPSPFYFVRSGSKAVEWAYTPHVQTGQLLLPDECPPRVRLVLRKLSRVPREESSRATLAKALGLYGAAGDAELPHDRFLGMWQALEALSLADGGDTTKIARNVGNLWRNGSETVHYQLLALAPFRNSLVHVGEYNPHRQSATFLLNAIVRDAIMQFAQLSDRLTTKEHFREFMSMMTLPKSKLAVRTEAIRAVTKIRGL